MKRVHFCNLGCSKNVIDGERMAAYLRASGLEIVDDPVGADAIVVNTCAFIQEAKEEAIETVLEMARHKKGGNCRLLAVAGCFSERYRTDVARKFPEVDLWVGLSDWPDRLKEYFQASGTPSFERHLTGSQTTQYLKISEGCSHRCAFCAIPSIRGSFRSRPVKAIVEEARWLRDQGVTECILVSQDTTHYGSDIGESLPGLLESLLKGTSFPWIRMMYLHPRGLADELLKLVAAETRLCRYFDIPLQHIADPILRSMRRRPLAAGTRKLIERIRHAVPDAAIRTTFILGFPGEKREHFRELMKFVEWARFDKLGVFPFSPEEGTRAYGLRPRVRGDTTRRRCEDLMALQREISRETGESRLGRTLPVIIDEISDDPDYNFVGRTQWDAPEIDGRVHVLDGSHEPGQIADLRIVDADDYDLFAATPGDRPGG